MGFEPMDSKRIREPAVAGRFYPSDPTELRRAVTGLLDAASEGNAPEPRRLLRLTPVILTQAQSPRRPTPGSSPPAERGNW